VEIRRQTNARTVPAENGYFDCKVLSRQHAEVWEENAKTSKVPMVPSSTVNVSAQGQKRANRMN
jgi:hypothetical protein